MDLCGNETVRRYAGYGGAGSGIIDWIGCKPGISKGGQTVLIADSNRICPRANIHMHKLHKIHDDWTLTDQSEVCNIVEQLLLHIDGDALSCAL